MTQLPKEGFIDVNKYPQIQAICDTIREHDAKLKRIASVLPYVPWYDQNIYNHGWTVASMRYAYKDFNPFFKWLQVPLVQTSGFSVLQPGTRITPHRGYAGDVFRIHYGLDCPEGDCMLRAGEDKARWENGEFLMFNDLDEHEAWNNTDKPRLILLFDILKSRLDELDPVDIRVIDGMYDGLKLPG